MSSLAPTVDGPLVKHKILHKFIKSIRSKLSREDRVEADSSAESSPVDKNLAQWEILFYLKFRNLINHLIQLNYRSHRFLQDSGDEFNFLVDCDFPKVFSVRQMFLGDERASGRTEKEPRADFAQYSESFLRESELK